MASSYWDKNFPNIAKRTTEKLYYNRYAYRIEFWVNRRMGRSIWDAAGNAVVSEENLLIRSEWWTLINAIAQKSKKMPETGIKVRREGSCVQIYSEIEEKLRATLDFLIKELGLDFVRRAAIGINFPDPNKPLAPGIRYVKTKPSFRYEIKIRSRAFYEHRDSIRAYIKNLGPETAQIRGNFPLVIITNDLANLDFLRLMVPNSIGQILELVKAD